MLINFSPNLEMDEQGKVIHNNEEEEQENSYQFSDQLILKPKKGEQQSDKEDVQSQDNQGYDN